jgi:hypothetical protein
VGKEGGVGAAASKRKEKGRVAPPPLKRAAFRVRCFFFLYFSNVSKFPPISLCELKTSIYRQKCC